MMKKYSEQAAARAEKRGGTKIVYVAVISALILTLALSLTALVLTAKEAGRSEDTLQSYYKASLTELSDSVDGVELRLSKLSVGLSERGAAANLDELTTLCATVVCALSRLPVSPEQTLAALKLLNQVADYAKGYEAALARGADTSGHVGIATQFRRAVDVLQQRVSACLMRAESGAKICPDCMRLEDLPESGDSVTQSQPAYPEMIYDGPFSDSRLPACFKGLENLKQISESEAEEKFYNLFGVRGKIAGRSSHPDAYEIYGDGAYAAISVSGGMVLNYDSEKSADGSVNLGREDAFLHAAEYAAKLGYGNVSPVWYYCAGPVAYVNMAPTAGGAVLYTDLVKVKLSLTDGTLLGLEATGYCRNHTDRDVRAAISATTAAKLSGIEHDSVRLSVIPDGETEAVCYEVHGYLAELEFYVYIDAVTGEKVQVLKVVGDAGGRLTE